ncbi:Rossmann-like and DUF2520 domain-containing protein [Gleimia hominis]|uniref:Rossmann-like and DUF2520 domain-containing protein n=1 Tax=Gleimia hominis TaxID=595468 RepID=UPI0035E44C16
MPARFRIGVVGAGRVGPTLGLALQRAGHSVVAVTRSRSEERNDRVAALLPNARVTDADQVVAASDLVIVAVPDDQIAPVVDGLAKLEVWRANQIVVHPCGAHGVAALSGASAAGAIPIALHPAMTFTGTSLDVDRLVNCPVAVTAPAVGIAIGQALVMEMGATPYVVEEEDRAVYHAALAHGANYLVTIVSQAVTALSKAGIDEPAEYIQPLLNAALERALSEGAVGLTGPVVRGDMGTISAHVDALRNAGLASVARTYMDMAEATAQEANEVGLIDDATAEAIHAELLYRR